MKLIFDTVALSIGYVVMAVSGIFLATIASYAAAEELFKLLKLYEHLYRFIVVRPKFEAWLKKTHPEVECPTQ